MHDPGGRHRRHLRDDPGPRVVDLDFVGLVYLVVGGSPFHLSSTRLDQYYGQVSHFISQHQSLIACTVVTGGKIVLEVLTGLVLMIFITFFLLKDGERIWAWLIKGLPPEPRRRAGNAPLASPPMAWCCA